ncbi:putative bifunctional diguanylate cyclase/phosphodiesterase [Ideonella sp. A 288]|uniref:putative bifunctional diguanylate cyclase/phosphodiesterase n=1 Tax=Ideonella sp. A 288 TaxID=1962181 RepID=UPI003855C596
MALFESASEGLLACDPAGRVVACSLEAARLLHAEPGDVQGGRVVDWITQDACEHVTGAAAPAGLGLEPGDAFAREGGGLGRPLDLRLTAVDTPSGRHWLVHLRDATQRVKAEAHLAHMANYDSLTGLPNRLLFQDRLKQAMKRARRSGTPMALMFLDLDRFKLVNDSLGHEVGDRLLKHVATTLTACMRQVDSVVRLVDQEGFTLSRLGGDEFTLIAEAIECAEDAALIARRLLEALHSPFRSGDEEIVVSASIGIAMYPNDDVDLDGLVRHADMAMYRSKSLGRGTYSFFSDDLNAAAAARLSLESGLRRAIERQEFQLYFQPKADLHTGEITGVEALIRWHCPGQGMVPPDKFIAVLEETGMILPVGAWVIRAACSQLAEWDRMGLPPLRMAVNLSARQFRHQYLASMVADTLRENYINPRRLEIELTESLLMEDNETNRGMLENLSRMGVRLAIDDFGTGHSSLSYIKRFNIDTLKIDRSFVQSLPENNEDVAIATAVIALGRSMRMNVVAEGVETQAQADLLRQLGCDEMQGYLLGRPMAAPDLVAWLQARQRADAARRGAYGASIDPMPLVDLGEPAAAT